MGLKREGIPQEGGGHREGTAMLGTAGIREDCLDATGTIDDTGVVGARRLRLSWESKAETTDALAVGPSGV